MMMSYDVRRAQVRQWEPLISGGAGGLINIKCWPNKHKELAEIKPPREEKTPGSVISIIRGYALLHLRKNHKYFFNQYFLSRLFLTLTFNTFYVFS